MMTLRTFATVIGLVLASLTMGASVQAQDVTPLAPGVTLAGLDRATSENLNAAMQTGDMTTINSIIGANPAAKADIAQVLLTFATANPNTTAGAAAAYMAITTGTLSGNQAISATNLVNSSGNTGIQTLLLVFTSTGVVGTQVANQFAQNNAQQCTSCN